MGFLLTSAVRSNLNADYSWSDLLFVDNVAPAPNGLGCASFGVLSPFLGDGVETDYRWSAAASPISS